MRPFKYQVSRKIIYWGSVFDSLLELKYAISIHKEFEFLHTHIPIYYDPRTFLPTNYIPQNIRRYTPDYIIRNKITRESYCVEIKPRAFEGNPQLEIRRKVVENYITWKNLDWKFKVIYDDEIKLTPENQIQFNECRKLLCKSARKLEFQRWNKLFDRSTPTFYSNVPDTKRIQFVMYGILPQKRYANHDF